MQRSCCEQLIRKMYEEVKAMGEAKVAVPRNGVRSRKVFFEGLN